MYARIVAMFGWIIPDLLHIPPRRTDFPPTSISSSAVLGTRSVVMIARAAAAPPSGLRLPHASAIPGLIASIGALPPRTACAPTTPPTPRRPSHAAENLALSRASLYPPAPGEALRA